MEGRTATMRTVELTPHPACAESPISAVCVDIARFGEGDLRLTYRLQGDLTRVRFPEPTRPSRTNELWKHTCFEAFVRPEGDEGYAELNFAPSLAWAAYRFDDYRLGMRPANIEPWLIKGRLEEPFELQIEIAIGRMARPDRPSPAWKAGLSAVIETIDGAFSYWALAHPSDKPDFHHPDSFILDLP